MGRVVTLSPSCFRGYKHMSLKRLLVAVMALVLLAGCAPLTVRGGESANFWSEYESCNGESSPRVIPDKDAHGGGGICLLGGSDQLTAAIGLIIVSAVGIYYASCESVDHIQRLSKPPVAGTIQDGAYQAPYGLFTVAVPGQFS